MPKKLVVNLKPKPFKCKPSECTLIQWQRVKPVTDSHGELICPRCGAPAEVVIGVTGDPCYAHIPKDVLKQNRKDRKELRTYMEQVYQIECGHCLTPETFDNIDGAYQDGWRYMDDGDGIGPVCPDCIEIMEQEKKDAERIGRYGTL